MKKIFALIIALATLMTLAGCSANADDDTTIDASENDIVVSTTANEEKESTAVSSNFPKAPSENIALESYVMEVNKRMLRYDNEESFVTDEERAFLEANGYDVPGRGVGVQKYSNLYAELSEYMFPVVYSDGNDIQLWYTSSNGSLNVTTIIGRYSGDYYGNIHCDVDGEKVVEICCEDSYTICYEESTGKVTTWAFGEEVNCFMVPEGSVYAGRSYWEGYIFRNGHDVYAVRSYGCYASEHGVEVIAHNVELVIQADYMMGSDDWSQPLFLMTDGTIKGYCDWYGDPNSAPDDESHLKEIRYEGGYEQGKTPRE